MAILIVVRRNARQTFEHLHRTFAQELGRDVELIWDRRTAERRGPPDSTVVERRVWDRRVDVEPVFLDARWMERRQMPEERMSDRRRAERRRRAPASWRVLGLVVVQRGPSIPGQVSGGMSQ